MSSIYNFNNIKRAAIIIGINEYSNLGEQFQLKGAVNDAEEIYSVLKKNGGFGDEDIAILKNRDAKRSDIISKLYDFLLKKESYEQIIFYFAGHGLEDNFSNTFLAPSDFDASKPHLNGILMSQLATITIFISHLLKRPIRQFVLF